VRFRETLLAGSFVVEPELVEDERGFFARTFCSREFAALGVDPVVAQCGISYNRERGTLRGLHYQIEPHQEAKLVACSRGRLFDVAVDLRPGSPTFGRWTAAELSADNHLSLYIPPGLAHGFVTLEPHTEVRYQISAPYSPDAARGVRWDDPDLNIDWPEVRPFIISDRDRHLPALTELVDDESPSAAVAS
jgi:dTDP-4-dehydrorhamnose 3,5-epimerase